MEDLCLWKSFFLKASKLIVTLAETLKPLPIPESLKFGEVCWFFLLLFIPYPTLPFLFYFILIQLAFQAKTDHMLVVNFDPEIGWSAPEIKPYGPLALDPMSSCFHYCSNVFEGMKVKIMFMPPRCPFLTLNRLTWDLTMERWGYLDRRKIWNVLHVP